MLSSLVHQWWVFFFYLHGEIEGDLSDEEDVWGGGGAVVGPLAADVDASFWDEVPVGGASKERVQREDDQEHDVVRDVDVERCSPVALPGIITHSNHVSMVTKHA